MSEPASLVNDSPRGQASPGKLAMLYDGECEMCKAGAEAMRKFDNSGSIETLDLHDPDARANFPELKLENLLEELHVVDDRGRVFRGQFANVMREFEFGKRGGNIERALQAQLRGNGGKQFLDRIRPNRHQHLPLIVRCVENVGPRQGNLQEGELRRRTSTIRAV